MLHLLIHKCNTLQENMFSSRDDAHFEMTSTFKCAWYFEQQGQEEMGLRDSKEDTYASQQCPLTNNRLIMWRRTKNKIKWEQKKAAPASSDATADIS